MGKYDTYKDGYARESTPGTSVIDGVGDTAYLFGAMSQEFEHPSPTAERRATATGVNAREVAAGLVFKSAFDCRGMYGFWLQNGIIFELTLGKSSTAGADPYTHTITPTTDGTAIPSLTINHEREGDATDEEYQFLGCKVDSLVLFQDLSSEVPLLGAKVEWMAMQAQDGIALTTAPALPATANTAGYHNLTRTWDPNGDNLSIDGMQTLEVSIVNGVRPLYTHTYDGGTYTGRWPYQLIEASEKQYQIRFTMHENTIERKIWDTLIGTTETKDLTLKWTRSANDYITITATDCSVLQCQRKTPQWENYS
ncbi:MAG: hypothetical protein ACXAEN_27325 [Candidatus Thorarchaeota archaeon]|jgi:hypothetical protein